MSGNRNILQNNEITSVASGQHKMYIVDAQDLTQSPLGSGKYIDVQNLVLNKIGVDFIPVNIYNNGLGSYIKANLRFAINDSDPAIVTTKSTVFTCTYSVGYTLYKALYAFKKEPGTYGVGGQTIALSDLNYIGREIIVDILDPDDLAVADNIQDSINESSNTFDTSIVNIFRRTIQGEVRVYAYTPENDYQEFIGFGQTPINEEDFTDITGNGNEESDNDITGFVFDQNTGNLTIETSQGDDFVVSLGGVYATAAQGALADTAIQIEDLDPYSKRVDTARKLSVNPAGATISLLDENGNLLDTVSLGFLNNEGTTLVYNSTDETIEIRNDDNDLLSSIPVSSFVTNVGSNLNLSGSQIQLRDDSNAVLSTINLSISSVQGLQGALDGKATAAQGALAETAIQNIPTHTGDVTGDINLTITDGVVTTSKIVNNAVTSDKLESDSVTNVKIADSAVRTSHIASSQVTNTKLGQMASNTIKGNNDISTGNPKDLTPTEVKALLSLDSDYATVAQGALADTSVQLAGNQTITGDKVIGGRLITGGGATLRDKGIYGIYSPSRWGHIWSMGTAYKIAEDGVDAGNLHGAAYRYSASDYGKGHQFVWCINGNPNIALGSNLWVANKAAIGVEDPTEKLEVAGNVKATAFIGDLPISSTQGDGVTVTNESDGLKVEVDSVDTSNLVKKTGETSQTITGNINGIGLLSATTFVGNVTATSRLAMPSALGVPTSTTSSGLKGELRYDDDYLYVCIDTNSWKRISLTSW